MAENCAFKDDKRVKYGSSCVACPTDTSSRVIVSTQQSCNQCKDTYFASESTCYHCTKNMTLGLTKAEAAIKFLAILILHESCA